MELSYRFIDLHKTQQTTHGYADIIPRESMKGAWYVPKYTLLADEQHWQVVTSGKLVEVPLVPYITPPNTLSVFGFAAQLGIIARGAFDGHKIIAMRLSIGVPVADVVVNGTAMWRIHFGLAVLLE
jgi:hypothetical protein